MTNSFDIKENNFFVVFHIFIVSHLDALQYDNTSVFSFYMYVVLTLFISQVCTPLYTLESSVYYNRM